MQSYDRLISRPPQYGAPWDAVVGNSSGPQEAAQVAAQLSRIKGIDGAAGLIDLDQQFVGKEDIPFVVFVAAGDLPQNGRTRDHRRARSNRARGDCARRRHDAASRGRNRGN